MSKKYSPTSLSSKVAKSKKDLPQQQQSEAKRSRSSNKSFDKQSGRLSGNKSEVAQSQTSLTQEKVMQQAIEKASCLIELLTRQNSESKLHINDLLQQLSQLKSQQKQLQTYNNQLLQQLTITYNNSQNLQRQNQQLLFQLEKLKLHQNDQNNTNEKLLQTKNKNIKLHQKIASITNNHLQLSKQFQKLKKQFKSLQNQNEFLLQQLKTSYSKQNVFQQNFSHKQNLFEQKLKQIQNTKQAFATRTHQLKKQNFILLKEIESIRKQKYDLELISRQSMQTLTVVTKKIESYRYVEEKVHHIYQKIKFVMQEGSNNTFSRTQMSVKQKLDQIETLVTYRVQHIENLMKKICERVEKPQWKCNLRELNQAKILAQRLSTYLSELSAKPQLQS